MQELIPFPDPLIKMWGDKCGMSGVISFLQKGQSWENISYSDVQRLLLQIHLIIEDVGLLIASTGTTPLTLGEVRFIGQFLY